MSWDGLQNFLGWGVGRGKIIKLSSSFGLKEAMKIGGGRKCCLQKLYEQVNHHQTRLIIDLYHFGMKV